MRVTGKKILAKLKLKQRGNSRLLNEIDLLIHDLESNEFTSFEDLKKVRIDADKVHNEGFYFFNIHIHRTLILMEMNKTGEATIVWAGSHQEYEELFRNNKGTISKWLKQNGWIAS
jgi:hypothetical protein